MESIENIKFQWRKRVRRVGVQPANASQAWDLAMSNAHTISVALGTQVSDRFDRIACHHRQRRLARTLTRGCGLKRHA